MAKHGQKRKSIAPATNTNKSSKLEEADENEIQSNEIGQSEAEGDGKPPNKNVEEKNVPVVCDLGKDIPDTYDQSSCNEKRNKLIEETQISDNAVHTESNLCVMEMKTNITDNESVGNFAIETTEIGENDSAFFSIKDKSEVAIAAKMSSASNINSSEKTDSSSSNENTISCADSTSNDSSKTNIENDKNSGLETNEQLDSKKDTKSDNMKQDSLIERTAETSNSLSEMDPTETTCFTEHDKEESSIDADADSRINYSKAALSATEKESTGDSNAEMCLETTEAYNTIEIKSHVKDTSEHSAANEQKDQGQRETNNDGVESINDIDESTKEREALTADKTEREIEENIMEEVDKNDDDIDSIQSQPISHVDEDIYLQSTAPVKFECNDIELDDDASITEDGGIRLENNYESLLQGSQPVSTPVTREEVTFQSPRPGDEATKFPGNLVDDPVPRTAAEIPEIDEHSSQVLATEPKDTTTDIDDSLATEVLEMEGGEIVDDLTDSQLCAMDWSSQLPQEPCIPQQFIGKSSLPPPPTSQTCLLQPRQTGLPPSTQSVNQPHTRGKPQDGTAIMKGLIREVAQLNKMVLKTKREMETVRHQRQHTFSLNRR